MPPRFFQYIDAALLRAVPRAPADLLSDMGWPEMTTETADLTAHWTTWLRQVWANPKVADAIEVASPVLARRLDDLVAGRPIEVRRLRRMVLSMVRYLVRMKGRATPFGLFAGVAATQFADRATVRWGEQHRAVAETDSAWLNEVVTRLESCTQLVPRLSVVISNVCFVRGGRLVLPSQGHAHRNGRLACAEVSVRHTAAVQLVLEAARRPISCAEVAARLAAAFPDASEAAIEGMLTRLVHMGILVSGLRAPGSIPGALGHLLDQLTRADTHVAVTARTEQP